MGKQIYLELITKNNSISIVSDDFNEHGCINATLSPRNGKKKKRLPVGVSLSQYENSLCVLLAWNHFQ